MKKFFIISFLIFSLFSFGVKNVLADSVVETVYVGGNYVEMMTILGGKIYIPISSLNSVVVVDPENNYATSSIVAGSGPATAVSLGSKVYVTNYTGDSVTIIDTENGNTTEEVAVGDGPYFMTTLGSNVYVANGRDDTVTIIDSANNTTTTVNVGDRPQFLTTLGSKVYVSNNSSTFVSIIDTENGNSATTVETLGVGAQSLVAVGTKVYVANQTSDSVSVIDTENNNATSTIEGFPSPYFMKVLGSKIYVTNVSNNEITIIDTANNDAITSLELEGSAYYLTTLGSKVYVANYTGVDNNNSVTIIDTANGNTTSTLLVGEKPYSLISLDSRIYVYNESDATLSIIETDSTAPTVSLTSPSSGASVSGIVSLSATASDTYTVEGVQFKVNGTNIGTEDTTSPYSTSWNSTTVAAGSYTLQAVARDLAGNYATSSVSVTVSSPSSNRSGSAPKITQALDVFTTQQLTLPPNATREQTIQYLVAKIQELLTLYNQIKAQEGGSTTNTGDTVLKGFQFTKTFGLNTTDKEVRYLQRFLNTHGFPVGSGLGSYGKEVDTFGPVTKATLIKYQLANGIEGTGYFGNLTRQKVNQTIAGE